ncbi:MAG: YhdH/YhfP family quinone oxidoreductase [Bacteroidota bacterium]
MAVTFRAYRVFEKDNNTFTGKVVERSTTELPDNDVLIKVHYSGLNYKDALSAAGNKGVTRKYPHTPGIDAAGVVVESNFKEVHPKQEVIVTGFDLGMNTDGGFGEYIRVPHEWVVALPEGLSLKKSMVYGTAGFTAAQLVEKLRTHGVSPEKGPVIVTGAAGGVGSLSVLLLKKLGFEVVAATSNIEDSADTISLVGADKHVDKSATIDTTKRMLLPGKYAGAIDCVGGDVLATLLKSVMEHGHVATCGNILSHELHTTVFPFILRGIGLHGVTSQNTAIEDRKRIWNLLADEYAVEIPEGLIREISLEELESALQKMTSKKNRGQVLLCHT